MHVLKRHNQAMRALLPCCNLHHGIYICQGATYQQRQAADCQGSQSIDWGLRKRRTHYFNRAALTPPLGDAETHDPGNGSSFGSTQEMQNVTENLAGCVMPPFFRRVEEEERLQQFVDQLPSQVLVLYGPEGSGKTSLVKHVLVPGDTDCARQGICSIYLDLGRDVSDPKKLAESIADQVFKLSETMARRLLSSGCCREDIALKPFLDYVETHKNRRGGLDRAKGRESLPCSLASVLEDFRTLLSDLRSAKELIDQRLGLTSFWPVLCIDHAEGLAAWASADRNQRLQLQLFLHFLGELRVRHSSELFCVFPNSQVSYTPFSQR